MSEKRRKQVFVEGPITPSRIAESIEKHSTMHGIGGHSIFLGQVRADEIDGKAVAAIEYSCYPEMAEAVIHDLREETFAKFQLSCMHIYHSLGRVEAGGISLFVFTSSKHRAAAIDACSFVVEAIKSKVPIWGKELFIDDTHTWKQNI